MCCIEVKQLCSAQLWAQLVKYRPSHYLAWLWNSLHCCSVLLFKYLISFIIYQLWKSKSIYNGCNLREEKSQCRAACWQWCIYCTDSKSTNCCLTCIRKEIETDILHPGIQYRPLRWWNTFNRDPGVWPLLNEPVSAVLGTVNLLFKKVWGKGSAVFLKLYTLHRVELPMQNQLQSKI